MYVSLAVSDGLSQISSVTNVGKLLLYILSFGTIFRGIVLWIVFLACLVEGKNSLPRHPQPYSASQSASHHHLK